MESRRIEKGCILKDILETNVEEKYYLSEKSKTINDRVMKGYRDSSRTYSVYEDSETLTRTLTADGQNSGQRQLIKVNNAKSQSNRVYSVNGLCKTLTGEFGGGVETSGLYDVTEYENNIKCINIQNNTKKGYLEATENDGINISRASSNSRRGRVRKDSTGTLLCGDGCDWGVHKDYRIRRLTPLECERLQGFPDNYTREGVDGELIIDTQRYKCCGNAVTTNVITHIFNNWSLK